MKLTSLRLSKKEAKEETVASIGERPRYPYWADFRLDDEDLEKLGLPADGLPIGCKVTIEAEGIVSGVDMHQDQDKDRCSVRIQMQKMGIEEAAGERKKRAADAHLNAIGGSKD